MEHEAYIEMHSIEQDHWWYRARRNLLTKILDLHCQSLSTILEVGSGTGGNVHMLEKLGTLTCLEIEPLAIELSKTRNHNKSTRFYSGFLPGGTSSIENKIFDLICMFDVLEHIEDRIGALQALHEHMGSSSTLFITVPSYQWMWAPHDERLHHKRRYTRKRLIDDLKGAGFEVIDVGYFNTLLFPVAVISRFFGKLTRTNPGEKTPTPWINDLLLRIFNLEVHTVGSSLHMFGLSTWGIFRIEAKENDT